MHQETALKISPTWFKLRGIRCPRFFLKSLLKLPKEKKLGLGVVTSIKFPFGGRSILHATRAKPRNLHSGKIQPLIRKVYIKTEGKWFYERHFRSSNPWWISLGSRPRWRKAEIIMDFQKHQKLYAPLAFPNMHSSSVIFAQASRCLSHSTTICDGLLSWWLLLLLLKLTSGTVYSLDLYGQRTIERWTTRGSSCAQLVGHIFGTL